MVRAILGQGLGRSPARASYDAGAGREGGAERGPAQGTGSPLIIEGGGKGSQNLWAAPRGRDAGDRPAVQARRVARPRVLAPPAPGSPSGSLRACRVPTD